jgi:hypothetical protein
VEGDAVVVVVLVGDDGAASADGEASGAAVVVGATEGVADASALLLALLFGWESSLVAVGVLIGVTGVAGRDLALRYQMSAVRPRRMVAASSRTRARGLKAIDK